MPKLPHLKAIRERKLLTQRELAKAAGISPTTVNRIETGTNDPEFRTIRALAKALGVDPQELLGEPE